ncbi:putative phage abortive infection protein [Pseudoalteromonas ruthenica]|uniref:putative phage abortive infection protein n=1 Tax=Pseudoalteromonas ruthenica TaxID=151081 RepID=UPI0011086636|nr:putative phage abortive infection protein [Pseudoalteromonas ruthenica]
MNSRLSRYLFRIAQSAIYIALSLLVINLLFLIIGKSSTLGAFGDFLGGTLNPVFTFLMLIGLIITIVLQKIELTLARKEFARSADSLEAQNINIEIQRFESTFFRLLEFFDACRNDVEYKSQNSEPKLGREAFRGLYNHFVDYELHDWEHSEETFSMEPVWSDKSSTAEGVQRAYVNFYKGEHGEDLGAYFRTLYNILKLIEQTKNITDKQLYSNLIRAQLSRYELLILFYNILSPYGNEKMKELVMEFKLLKHLETELLPEKNRQFFDEFKT